MHFADLTFAHTPTSGGIRTFIERKRQFLLQETEHRHTLIVPGEEDAVRREGPDGRATVVTIASPFLPGCRPYRWFVRPGAVLAALERAGPEVVELGTFLVEPWVAFRYRRRRVGRGERCVVGGYFHTDLARAYAGAWARARGAGEWLARRVEAATERGFGAAFRRCDRMLAATVGQATRLRAYGVERAEVVPLGVDAERFHPRWRSAAGRAELGARAGEKILLYAGRLDREKQVGVLVEAWLRLREQGFGLWLMGEGAERPALEAVARGAPGLRVWPYERDPERLAERFAAADVYVTAGPHETFGLSVIEAQASGLPVVGVDAGALRERVVPGTGRLVPVGDAAALADAVRVVALRRDEMGAAARRHVEVAGLTWEASLRRWLAVYASGGEVTVPVGGAGAAGGRRTRNG